MNYFDEKYLKNLDRRSLWHRPTLVVLETVGTEGGLGGGNETDGMYSNN